MRLLKPGEYINKYGQDSYMVLMQTSPQVVAAQKPNVFQRIKNTINQAGVNVADAVTGQGEFVGQSNIRRATGAVASAFNAIPQVAVDVLPEPARKGVQAVGKTAVKAIDWLGDKLGSTQLAQDFVTRHPEAAKTLEEIAGTASNLGQIAGDILIANQGTKALQKGIDVTKKSGRIVLSKTKSGFQAGQETTRKITQSIQRVAEPFVEEAKRIPDRFRTNVAQKKAVQQTINQLPAKVARQAAQDGLDIVDIKKLYSIPKTQTASLRKLAVVTKQFAEGKTKTNPIEVVGKPIVTRLKELEQARVKVGAKLGEVADNLGVVTREELFPTIFQRLRKVSGLEKLGVDNVGRLNFKNTVLATAETVSDRKAIQSIFADAVKWGQGKNKHLLRQELFESLGGKKSASIKLTATQEKAYQAIRQGLSDVLESKNVGYKNLSNQYRKIISPLQAMRKMMKVAGEADDVLDMSAGLLARRLTSMAQSNPQIRAILNAMDKATKKAGKTRLSVETLQDFYNILEKYYDIAPKTGFQAQVRQGVEKAVSRPLNFIGEQIKGFAGETTAVRQKALEKILNEILN